MKFQTNRHAIYQEDALVRLSKLESGSVDLIFADPPYNIGKDFDGLKEDWSEDDYLDWSYKWINECRRVLKAEGTFYLMTSTENMPYFDIRCRSLFTVQSRIVWTYDSSGVQAKRYFGSLYEPILMLTKHKSKYTFNASDIEVEARTGATRKLIDYRKSPPQPYNTKKVPGNVWAFPRVRFKMHEYENHPTQKPEALMERIILASSNPDDVVMDPFAGSHTTGAVAKRHGRRSISIEINPEYVKMGLRRLEIPSHYSEDDLKKVKKRKTNNKSKHVRDDSGAEQQNLI